MKLRRTRPDPNPDPWGPPTYVTSDTHRWDGSEASAATAESTALQRLISR